MKHTREINNKILSYFTIIFMIYVIPLLILNRLFIGHNIEIDLFLIHIIMYVAQLVLLMLFTKSHKASFIIVNILEFIFAVISYLKVEARCEIFEPWDLSLIGSVKEILSFIDIDFIFIMKFVAELLMRNRYNICANSII